MDRQNAFQKSDKLQKNLAKIQAKKANCLKWGPIPH